jgi:hypothetical protein
VRFNVALDDKIDNKLSEFRSRLRQIHTFTSATNAGQLEYAMKSGSRFSDLDGQVAGLRTQCEQMGERLADIEEKLDQVVQLLTPKPIR